MKQTLKGVDVQWGSVDGSPGTRGKYTELQARHNLWHTKRYGKSMYMTAPGLTAARTAFVPRYPYDKHAQRVQEYGDWVRAGSPRVRPHRPRPSSPTLSLMTPPR